MNKAHRVTSPFALLLSVCSVNAALAQTVNLGGTTYEVERIGGSEIIGTNNDPGDFTQPTYVTQAPGDTDILYIVERGLQGGQLGQILRYDTSNNTRSTFLDLNGPVNVDGGLLAIAFHPSFQSNGLFYASIAEGFNNRIVEYKVENGTPTAERTIMSYDQGGDAFHTINWVGFQPNGDPNELFVTTGDGGFQRSSGNFDAAIIENVDSAFGKILTIDVDASTDFTTPVDGLSYVGTTGTPLSSDPRATVIANGLRNPYRASFDSSGGLYFGDVGFNTREELDYLSAEQIASPAVENFGWPQLEGTLGSGLPSDIAPIFEYDHGSPSGSTIRGNSVTGGYEFDGRYYFGDFVSNVIASGVLVNGVLTDIQQHTADLNVALNDFVNSISSFGVDNEGNLYIVDFGGREPGQAEIFRVLAPPLAGDFNDDGVVDAADYTIWRDNEGQAVTLPNETATPGFVDAADYNAWLSNFGAGAAAASLSAVPEPVTATLLLGAAAVAALRRRGE